jgi:hypothetical protein
MLTEEPNGSLATKCNYEQQFWFQICHIHTNTLTVEVYLSGQLLLEDQIMGGPLRYAEHKFKNQQFPKEEGRI